MLTSGNKSNLVRRSGGEDQNFNTAAYKQKLFLDEITDGIYNNNLVPTKHEKDIARLEKKVIDRKANTPGPFTPNLLGCPVKIKPQRGLLFIGAALRELPPGDQTFTVQIFSDKNSKVFHQQKFKVTKASDGKNNWQMIECLGG